MVAGWCPRAPRQHPAAKQWDEANTDSPSLPRPQVRGTPPSAWGFASPLPVGGEPLAGPEQRRRPCSHSPVPPISTFQSPKPPREAMAALGSAALAASRGGFCHGYKRGEGTGWGRGACAVEKVPRAGAGCGSPVYVPAEEMVLHQHVLHPFLQRLLLLLLQGDRELGQCAAPRKVRGKHPRLKRGHSSQAAPALPTSTQRGEALRKMAPSAPSDPAPGCERKEGRRCCPLTSLFMGSSQS